MPVPLASDGDSRRRADEDALPPAIVSRRGDGSIDLASAEPLEPHPVCLTDPLRATAAADPDRVLLTWRDGQRREALTYGETWTAIRSLGQALLDRRLSADRPLVILSGNDRWHALLALAALHVGVPYAPVSPAYSLVSRDFGTLRSVIDLVTPGLVFAADDRYAPAIAAVAGGTDVITPADLRNWQQIQPTATVDVAHAGIGTDDLAKILFTSGSTGSPKGVINTHGMLCSNQQMLKQALPLHNGPPILADWLPWHHTFGGNHNFGIVVFNGGTLHIDGGRPMPGAFDESLRTLRDVRPTIYLNVPRGFEELARALRADRDLAVRFFGRVEWLFYAAAALAQPLADELRSLSLAAIGRAVPLLTGYGMTEAAPMAIGRSWDTAVSTNIGLPMPGLDLRLVPIEPGRYEVRLRGPNVTPGYWRRDDLTAAAFDEDGFYRTGDAVRLVDPARPGRGVAFDGRVAEDFKLSTGTWVHVGVVRARIATHFAPYVRDAVITGHDGDTLGMLAVPDVGACRTLAGLPGETPEAEVVAHPAVRTEMARRLGRYNADATGSASRIPRMMLLDSPLSLDAQEVTDKGSLNQRVVLRTRRAWVEELHAARLSPRVITEEIHS